MTDSCRDDPRVALLRHWLEQGLGWHDIELAPASADASFRRYFRVTRPQGSCIAMDAPPATVNVEPYLAIEGMLVAMGVNAPRVLHRNATDGFLLVTDLGSVTYLDELADRQRAGPLYSDAVASLLRIQAHGNSHATRLPPYDEKLLRFELSIFTDWLVDRHLGLVLHDDETRSLAAAFDLLVANALAQPRVFVHRDYHSRNLMVCEGANPGILDFQDAVFGPVTYDLVSLLRDCYIDWPQEWVVDRALEFRRRAAGQGLDVGADDQQFLRWFDLTGAQRHLKASGIFARLWHRDGKPGYLAEVPRTLGYVEQVCGRHADLSALGVLIRDRVLPAVQASLVARSA